jgi:RNA polymerase sigma-70 factor, ECF subfamily
MRFPFTVRVVHLHILPAEAWVPPRRRLGSRRSERLPPRFPFHGVKCPIVVYESVGTLGMPKVLHAPTDDLDDERDLIRRIRASDRAAAEVLVERTYGVVYASLVRLCADPDLAADLTQDTYRKAWQSFDSFRGGSKISTWLYRIAYTTFLNHARRPPRLQPVDEMPRTPADPAPLPDELLAVGAEQASVREAVMTLDEKQRFVVTAHFWGELPIPEIARLEGVTAVAIRKRLKKALAQLEERIGEHHE